jgi:hypothetical protein
MTTTIRKAVLAALLAGAATVAATIPPVSEAAPAGNCTFYSNASHSTVVGRHGKDCCNNPVNEGTTSQYYVCGGCFICFPPPPR